MAAIRARLTPRHGRAIRRVYQPRGGMELDLVSWFTDTRVLEIVFCAACVTVLRVLSVADERRDHAKRRKLR